MFRICLVTRRLLVRFSTTAVTTLKTPTFIWTTSDLGKSPACYTLMLSRKAWGKYCSCGSALQWWCCLVVREVKGTALLMRLIQLDWADSHLKQIIDQHPGVSELVHAMRWSTCSLNTSVDNLVMRSQCSGWRIRPQMKPDPGVNSCVYLS